MVVLADFQTFMIGLTITQLIVTVAMGVGLTWLGVRQRRLEKLEDRVEAYAKTLIDVQFSSVSSMIETFKKRFADGDDAFDDLARRDQAIELAVAAKFDLLKDFMRQEMATRKDLDAHQQRAEERNNAVSHKLQRMGEDIAVLKDQAARRES